MVNFGNPYKEKRANSLIPEKYYSQAPSMQQGGFGSIVGSPRTPPGSPPHETFDSVEEGEAMFVRTSPSRSSPKREDFEDIVAHAQLKRQRTDSVDETETHPFSEKPDAGGASDKSAESKPPAPPKRPPPVPTKPPNAPVPPLSAHPPSSSPIAGSQSRSAPPKKAPPPPPRPPPPKPPQATAPSPKSAAPVPAKADSPPVSGSGRKSPAGVHGSAASLAPSAPAAAAPSPVVEPQLTPKPQTVPPHLHRGSISAATGAPPPPAADAPQSPDQKPLVDLPPGWMCVWSKSQRRWYFFDTKTNKSVWKWPPGS